MPLKQADRLHLQSLINSMTARFLEYANSRAEPSFLSDKRLSWRKEAIARTAIAAMNFIQLKACNDEQPSAPVVCQSRGNSSIVNKNDTRSFYDATESINQFTFEVLPPKPAEGDYQLQAKVIYLEFLAGESRYPGALKGQSLEAYRYGDYNQSVGYYNRYQCHFLDKYNEVWHVWCDSKSNVTSLSGHVNRGCSIVNNMRLNIKIDILNFLSTKASLDYTPPVYKTVYNRTAYVDQYTCPVLLGAEEQAKAFDTLQDCFDALGLILENIEAEHNRVNLEAGKAHIPPTTLDGKPNPADTGSVFGGFFSRTFLQSELHTLCREGWQLVQRQVTEQAKPRAPLGALVSEASRSRGLAPAEATVVGTSVNFRVPEPDQESRNSL